MFIVLFAFTVARKSVLSINVTYISDVEITTFTFCVGWDPTLFNSTSNSINSL